MLALVLAAAIATMPQTFECGRWEASAGASDDQLIPLADQEFKAQYASSPRIAFGAFPAPYDIQALDVLARVDTVARDDGFERKVARIAIAVRRHERTKYYRLVDEKGNDFDLEDEAPEEREDGPQLDIRFGTPDRKLPIVCISVATSTRGAHSGFVEKTAVFIDAGFARAKIIGETDCSDGWMGGACTAYDAAHDRSWGVKCSWDAAARDYACESRRDLDTEWTKRHAVVNIRIFAHRESPPPGAIATLQELANDVRAGRPLPMPTLVAGIGVLRPAGMLANRWQLFVTTGTWLEQLARIYAVDLTGSDPAELIPVSTLRPEPDEEETPVSSDRDREDQRFTPIDREFTIEMKDVAREQSLHVVSLLLTESGHRALFWIGGNAATGDLDALRLASDAPAYVQCNRFEVPDSASSVVVRKPFEATLRIEPHWTMYDDAAESNEQAEYCARVARVTWSDSFDLADTIGDCTRGLPARRVVIGERGDLSTAALPLEPAH